MSVLGVVTNPTAASGRGAQWAEAALKGLRTHGHRVVDLTRTSWSASLDAAMAARHELDALVVVGGDGMVNLGLQVCADLSLPLGVVAAGSGNDAATSWGLPVHNVEAAIAAIESGLQGSVASVDLGRIEGERLHHGGRPRYFAAVLSAGIDAAVAARAATMRYPRGPLKYKAATGLVLPRFRPYGARLRASDDVWEQECTLVAVANGPMFGGGLKIYPHADQRDGLLTLVVAQALKRSEIVRFFPRLRDGSHVGDPRVSFIHGKEFEIAPSALGAALPLANADGEPVGHAPLKVTSAPGALQVLGARLGAPPSGARHAD